MVAITPCAGTIVVQQNTFRAVYSSPTLACHPNPILMVQRSDPEYRYQN